MLLGVGFLSQVPHLPYWSITPPLIGCTWKKTVFLAGDSLGTTAERYNSDDGDIVEAHGGQARLKIKVNWLS